MFKLQIFTGAGPLIHKNWIGLILIAGSILFNLVSPGAGRAAPGVQEDFPDPRAQSLLNRLTPEEKVGQLFLVSFNGTSVDQESDIFDLIVNSHIGGVILLAKNDNFVGPDQILDTTLNLTRELQRADFTGTVIPQTDPVTGESFQPRYIPLFIGTSQEGNGFPNDQLLSGTTLMPSPMTIGATWDPELGRQAGEVVGRELEALGFNLLLGPSLDVLESPSPDGSGDLGVRTFGGDPFWVGEMGKAYIAGVHEGSRQRMAVVAKHFPGHGGSDRQPDEEVATVRKSLEQLKQIELAPFFAVTGNAPDPESTVDALLTSHIRYQGLQGNIRATTSPISFDRQAFELLMSQTPLLTWRENGGVVISDDLGSRAVRRFYDPDGQTFNGRIVALNAFLAGNDVLFMGDIVSSTDPDSATTIRNTIEFFAGKYRDDTAFAQRVDQSVLRILSLKYELYDSFNLDQVTPQRDNLESIGQSGETTFTIANEGATLVSPPSSELDDVIPEPPGLFDRIIFFSDSYTTQQCSECPEEAVLAEDALQNAVVRLYGPDGGGRVLGFNLVSFSFEELMNVMDTGPGNTILERTLRSADWIVFSMLDTNRNRPSAEALRRFLDEQPNLYRNKNLIVFALDAPYFLDATDISKITAYYGLYSKGPEAIDIAARLLFKEIRPIPGALPVSVPGIGYDLISVTSPDPSQTIPLHLIDPGTGEVILDSPESPALIQDYKIGDVITVQTGVILDHNGNPIPDETPVEFIISVSGLELVPQVDNTRGGIAGASFLIENSGTLIVQAGSGDPPAISNPLEFDIPPENGVNQETPTAVEPTPAPTLEPTPTSPPPTPTPSPQVTVTSHNNPDLGDWFLALLVTGTVGSIAYLAGKRIGQMRWGFRWSMCALLGGLSAYTALTLDVPGATAVMELAGRWGVFWLTLLGAGVGLVLGYVWRALDSGALTSP